MSQVRIGHQKLDAAKLGNRRKQIVSVLRSTHLCVGSVGIIVGSREGAAVGDSVGSMEGLGPAVMSS